MTRLSTFHRASPLVAAATFLSFSAVLSTPVLAAGSDPVQQIKCPQGKVYDKQKQQCVTAQSGVVDDESLAAYAHMLAKTGRPEEALDVLDLIVGQNDPDVLNYRGYATRLTGKVDEGIGYYQQALAIAPDNILVREYLGEAYITKGEVELARSELHHIRNLCGPDCPEYVALAQAIIAGGGYL